MSDGKVKTTPAPFVKYSSKLSSQVARFQEAFDVPLFVARDLLAKGPYRCNDWRDLEARLSSASRDHHVKLLACLPDSEESQQYFFANLDTIARALTREIWTTKNLLELHSATAFTFLGSKREFAVSDVVPSLSDVEWQSLSIGPDAQSVLSTKVMINGMCVQLIATRAYFPEYLAANTHSRELLRCAEPFGEKLHIMWHSTTAWRNAALDYLALPEDDLDSVLSFPIQQLDEAMHCHSDWFVRSLDSLTDGSIYTDEEQERIVPLSIENTTYVVFGFPCAQQPLPNEEAKRIRLNLGSDRGTELFSVDGHSLCIEWLQPCEEHDDMFDFELACSISATILSHPECNVDSLKTPNNSRLFWIRPATGYDIRRALSVEPVVPENEEVFLLECDNAAFAEKVIKMVAAKRVYAGKSEIAPRNYFLDIDATDLTHAHETRIALQVIGKEKEHGYNLSTGVSKGLPRNSPSASLLS